MQPQLNPTLPSLWPSDAKVWQMWKINLVYSVSKVLGRLSDSFLEDYSDPTSENGNEST